MTNRATAVLVVLAACTSARLPAQHVRLVDDAGVLRLRRGDTEAVVRDTFTVTVKVGDTLELRLRENSTTGYRWTASDSGTALDLIAGGFVSDATPAMLARGLVGSGGTQTRTWVVRAPGEHILRFELHPPYGPMTRLVRGRILAGGRPN